MALTPERWRKVERLYHRAVEQPAAARAAWLAETCGTDTDLQREVEALLTQPASRGTTLEQKLMRSRPRR